jgi:hypothetical protein
LKGDNEEQLCRRNSEKAEVANQLNRILRTIKEERRQSKNNKGKIKIHQKDIRNREKNVFHAVNWPI